MYRFRSIESLLDKFQELEKQEIYFASPSELNDPVEGFMDMFWQGDAIVWKNLLKNYIRSIENFMIQVLLYGEKKKLSEQDIRVAFNDRGPYAGNSALTDTIIEKTFSYSFVARMPEALAARKSPVRRLELISYLNLLHHFVMDSAASTIFEKMPKENPFAKQDLATYNEKLQTPKHVIDLAEDLEIQNSNDPKATEHFYTILNHTENKILYEPDTEEFFKFIESNRFFLISNFAEAYVNKLETLVYHSWYSASFLEDCHNSSVWGHYGDQHRGVCLKFKTIQENGKECLRLKTEYGIDGAGNPQIDMIAHPFVPIIYSSQTVSVDFFRSIGTLPTWYIKFAWYKDGDSISPYGEHLDDKREKWLDSHWGVFNKRVSTKLADWSYEREQRIVLADIVYRYMESKDRRLMYDFNDLEAIIFGIKTSQVDKLRIAKIIKEKCRINNRKQFDFFQAYYSPETGKIETRKSHILNLE